MTIRLYDTRSASLVDLDPREPGKVGIYVCGPTVQSAPHIGHLRSALVYDIWRRWLTYRGLDVTLVRNVTDIDDKILSKTVDAAAEGSTEQWWALAYRIELEFTAGYNELGILPPTYEPRATANISEMRDLIGKLIERGHAYAAADDSGDVYFDTKSWPSYGELTRQKLDDMVAAADADPRSKRDPRDFALWKGSKPAEPESASWSSPWGNGRPGWHIECSAMSRRYLGGAFDIHGGGLDLRFPHHENELAQSTAAGDDFAKHWVHNGMVNVNGQKMSKSLGNSVFARDLLDAARPIVVRYLLGAAHYRSTIDYTDGSLDEAEAAFERLEVFIERAARRLRDTRFDVANTNEVPEEFGEAMDDDLAVPQALAVVHDTIRAGNAALDDGDLAAVATARSQVVAMAQVLGINPQDPRWGSERSEPAVAALSALVEKLIEDRNTARSARDFAVADRIRDELSAAGITVEDDSTESHWSLP
ncbi:cysteine--tRNA ligase [Salinibacterium sp. PAMC 21357]|uniref:cysteine--tRNA ligase n=1 Tax=Salinibacterium sp. PAMC 21357 TaxID=1112215 RepID=UPI000289D734|nr:cysteine--tRNA ligase [Salinibacterium sp. PAMC 21357]